MCETQPEFLGKRPLTTIPFGIPCWIERDPVRWNSWASDHPRSRDTISAGTVGFAETISLPTPNSFQKYSRKSSRLTQTRPLSNDMDTWSRIEALTLDRASSYRKRVMSC